MLRPRSLHLSAWTVALLLLVVPALAQSQTLMSEHLEVRFSEAPFDFEVVERSSGDVLLDHARTAFREDLLLQSLDEAESIMKEGSTIAVEFELGESNRPVNLRFTLATSRRVTVELHHPNPNARTTVAFEDDGQHYYGLWEHPHGGDLDNRGAEHALVGRDYQHEQVYAASIRAPFYMMSNGLGVYAETEASGHYTVARSDTTRFTFRTGTLTYHLLYGPSYKRVLQEYNRLAGPPDMPPTWAMSSIWWRNDHTIIPEQVAVENAQELLLRDVEMLQDYHIPASTMWIDRPFTTGEWGWGGREFADAFPNPGAMVQELNDNGMRLLYWITNRTEGTLKEGLKEKGLLFDGYTDRPAADLRKTEAYLHYQDYLDTLAGDVMLSEGKTGVQGYKIDRGGEGEMPDSLINKQVTRFNRLAHEQMEAHHGEDFLIFARSLYDKSRRWVAHWNGDTRDNFQALRTSFKNALRAGLMNVPMWGSDTGSFDDNPGRELYLRWIEFSTYSTMMEFKIEGKDQWYYGENRDPEVIDLTSKATQIHHELVPYTRSALYHAHQTGVPVMRAMMLEAPSDPTVTDMWDQFYYGPNLLVAPVSREGVREREVYLPAGRWLNYNDQSTVEQGGQTVTAPAPLGTVPRFVPEGAILPRGNILKANQRWLNDWRPALRIEVYPARSETTSFDYYTGEAVRTITSSASDEAIEISFDALDHDGQLEVYAENVTEVERNGETLSEEEYEYNAEQNVLTVSFSGATTLRLPGASSIF